MAPGHPLFGGAITATLPGSFVDASDFRQVPDNQEVLLSGTSDVSLILEVLQQVGQGTDAAAMDHAVRFHFDSLAHDNDATAMQVHWVDVAEGAAEGASTPRPALLYGTQKVKKFGKDHDEDDVHIWVAVWRLPSKNVDLVLSRNNPCNAALDAQAREFRDTAASLRIVDWTLFA